MKKLALSLMAIAITFASMAQKNDKDVKHKDKNHKEAKHHNKDRAEKLDLNDQQKAQVKAQNEQFKKQMEELKSSNLSDDQKKIRRKEILDARRTQMQAILTPEQKDKARKHKKDMIKNHDDRKDEKGKRGYPKDSEKMKEELNLTDAQASQLKAINEKFKSNLKSIRSNDALTADQKKEQLKQAQIKHKEAIGSLLTSDQKDRIKNRPNRRAVK